MSRTFIGRREELSALQEARRDLASSRGGAVLIGGETGIGKSRLLAQFVNDLREGKSRRIVVTAECLERVQQPFGPIRTLVAALAEFVGRDELTGNVRRAIAQLTRSSPELDHANAAEALERADLLSALVELVKLVLARQAVVMTIEDLHWADSSTLDVLAYAIPRLARSRFLLVATFRSDELERNEVLLAAVSQMLREPSVRRLTLPAFSRSEIRDLIDDALGERAALPASVRHDIEVRSEGNPFFAEELVKGALEAQSAGALASLPLSIRASILQRLATLSAEERRVLERAAVLGYRFDPALLALVTGSNVEALLPTLRRARDLNIVVEESDDARFRFRHALTRQTIYSGMLVFDARRLHGQILAALESLEDRERYIDALAYHAWEAKDAAKTLVYNERAGDAALEQRALAEAASCFERAREAATDDDDRARLAERAGTVASLQGRLAQAVDAFEIAYAIRLRRGELDAAATILCASMIDRNNLGDLQAAMLGETFLQRHGHALAPPIRDRLLVNTARLVAAQYDFVTADRLLSAISDPRSLVPRAYSNYLVTSLERNFYYGEAARWRALVPDFLENLPRIASPLQVIGCYTLVQMASHMGANDLAERALLDAQRLERDAGYGAIAVHGDAVRAAYYQQRGRLIESRVNLERALERPDIASAAMILAQTAPLLALDTGDANLVGRCVLPKLLEEARIAVDVDNAMLLGVHAEWLASRGAFATAQADLRLALRVFPCALPTLAPVLLAAARHLDASELEGVAGLAERSLAESDNEANRATLLLVRAVVAARTGRGAEAGEAALDAAGLAERNGWPLFAARALEVAGRSERARELYASCGASAGVARCGGAPVAATSVPAGSLLSAREMEVARLVALGLTNKVISERLAVGMKTVEKHMASIFRKLDVTSRVHVAAYVLEQAPGGEAGAAASS